MPAVLDSGSIRFCGDGPMFREAGLAMAGAA
jgi:hypothetical protein